jgi:dihydropteroate synthase
MDRTRFASRVPSLWQLRSRGLPCGAATLVMGILNVTPDSFSDGGLYRSSDEAAEAALAMYAAGAAIVDVGGESTRPGQHPPLAPQQEVDRVLPVIERILKAQPGAVLSIDTYHAATAAHAVAAGVEIVNDVSGFLWDSAMADTCARLRCGVILMHTRGRPEDWKTLPPIPRPEVVSLVSRELQDRLDAAHAAGVDAGRIVLDPGFGFGKGGEANFALLAGLGEFRMLGRPLLAGVSR